MDLCGSSTRMSQKCVSEERDACAWVMIHKCWITLHKQNFQFYECLFFFTNTHLFVKTNTQVTNPKFVFVEGIFVCIQQHCHLRVRRAGHLRITSYLLVDLCGSSTRTSQKCVSEERDARAWVMIHKCWVILHEQNFQFCKWLFWFYKWKIVYLQKHKYTRICKNQNTSYKL